jgi:hypothetical protein
MIDPFNPFPAIQHCIKSLPYLGGTQGRYIRISQACGHTSWRGYQDFSLTRVFFSHTVRLDSLHGETSAVLDPDVSNLMTSIILPKTYDN